MVSGVRTSWLIFEKNWVFSRSYSCSLASERFRVTRLLDLLFQIGVQVADSMVVLGKCSHHFVKAASQNVNLVVARRQDAL
jgi:hypothetical protein